MAENVKASLTVVMPAYNAAKYLKEAVESILVQTYSDFILLIINDGSTDETESIIQSFSDKRIQYIKNEKNIGLVAALNKGIDLTETEFMARMDADDIAMPERLKMQMKFLENNPDVGVCGTFYEKFGVEQGISVLFENDDEIKANLLFSNGICHPSVIIRTDLLKKNSLRFGVDFDYADGFGHRLLELEDYALWHKLKNYTKFHNIPILLLKYRREGQNLSAQNMKAIQKRRRMFNAYWLRELGIEATERELTLHSSLSDLDAVSDIKILRDHFDNILKANAERKIYPQVALEKMIQKQWDRFFYFLGQKGYSYVKEYWRLSDGMKWGQLYYFLRTKL